MDTNASMAMFGCDKDKFLKQVEKMHSARVVLPEGYAMAAMSQLSDAQEIINSIQIHNASNAKKCDAARQTINRAKLLLQHIMGIAAP